ncbi:undecaprenyl-phosphate glucose phosphotransferase [Paenibacillus aquistagni]|uniref:undecaprenyl-phosphate glucose phosphotransferase n=1 Tax=Paenibacillus aquistagni TaxID=1852522 RepID=UPI000B50A965|nr:undecaprenyl-phosphate glucose phosphotransferase [Paenibacillus aquistagni]NMM54256.1 undecaprenyl-phosphate glucose phosphotransferase [Paenibacillus aquistagni]
MLRKNQRFLTQLYIVADYTVIQVMFLLAFWIKFKSGWMEHENPLPIAQYAKWSLIYGVIAVIIGMMSTFYSPKRKKRFADDFFRIIQVQLISLFVLLSLLFFFKEVHISREYLAIYMVGNVLAILIYRYGVKQMLRHFREKGYNKQYVLILGAGSLGKRFYENLRQHPDMGYDVVGFLDDQYGDLQSEFDEQQYKPILGTLKDLTKTIENRLIDEVIIALPLEAHHKFPYIIHACEKAGIRTLIIPDFFDYLPARPTFDNFAGMPLINVRDIPLDLMSNRILKRMFDIAFALIAIIITSPVLLLIAIGIKLTSPGPILFKQERVGLNRRNFYMYKFRSMKVSSDQVADTQWTTANDPRKTKFGSFLRKTSLDELPQFFNVLFGHMSVVGPRPERPYFVEQFKEEIPKYMVKHHVRPGITGWAQSNGLRGDTSIEERIRHDIFYIENWSLLFDIKIIWKTIWNGFVNKNAY